MVDIVAPNKGKQLNQTPSPLNAFKRAESLELSKWYMGTLMTNLAETKDTNGAFLLVQGTLVPGTEPPPHVNSREDELFYVLEGEFDVYVGEDIFTVETGECVFLPRLKPHAFIIRSPQIRLLTLVTQGWKKFSATGARLPRSWRLRAERSPIRKPI